MAAQVVPVAWQNDRFSTQVLVKPGKFVELCGRVAAGQKIDWSFEAPAALNFNIHYHEGDAVRFPAREDGVPHSRGMLDAVTGQDYCWMWSSSGDREVAVAVELRRH